MKICSKCHGGGRIVKAILPYGIGDYVCEFCGGTGYANKMTNEELLNRATCFEIVPHDPKRLVRCIKVELRTWANDPQKSWAIVDEIKHNLNHDGEWEHEPFPSSRTEDFFQRCRWSDLQEAIAFVLNHIEKYPTGYKPEPAQCV